MAARMAARMAEHRQGLGVKDHATDADGGRGPAGAADRAHWTPDGTDEERDGADRARRRVSVAALREAGALVEDIELILLGRRAIVS